MEMSHLVQCAQIAAPFLALFALVFTIRAGIQNKRADIMMECHRRFDGLSVLRHQLTKQIRAGGNPGTLPDLRADLDSWIQRFWSLQFDQFEFWRRGFIDQDFFRYWMISRQRDFPKPHTEGAAAVPNSFESEAFGKGFEHVAAAWACADSPRYDFKSFMMEIRNNRIDYALRQYGPSSIRRSGFWA